VTGGGRLVTAGRAHFSWDDLDRLLAAAIGATLAVLRRRLLLERPGWQLAHGYTTADVAAGAGSGPTAAFSRAFARAHGSPLSRHSGPFVSTGYHRLLSQPEAVADLVLTLPG
jgi:AraC-like DNA-binding protein